MCDCEQYLSSFQFGGIEIMNEQVIAIFCICDEANFQKGPC
jgi:hypothetical protein